MLSKNGPKRTKRAALVQAALAAARSREFYTFRLSRFTLIASSVTAANLPESANLPPDLLLSSINIACMRALCSAA